MVKEGSVDLSCQFKNCLLGLSTFCLTLSIVFDAMVYCMSSVRELRKLRNPSAHLSRKSTKHL